MSQDIRNMFARLSKKSTKCKTPKKDSTIIDSDDDIVEKTPKRTKNVSKKHKTNVISSDSEEDSKKTPKKLKSSHSTPDLKPLNLDDLNKPVKQIKPSKTENKIDLQTPKKEKKKKEKNTELGIHKNKDFEKTLMELDDDSNDTILMDNIDLLDKTLEEALHNNSNDKAGDNLKQKTYISEDEKMPKGSKKRQRKKSESEVTPNKKAKLDYTDAEVDTDKEKWEKRRHSAALYQQYLHRGGPKKHGQKEYPKGTSNCLSNLTFLRTGVLDSLESDEFNNLVQEHGGRIVHAVSKKVNYVVVGDQPGPSKLEKARNYNIKEISEDEFLDLILTKSGKQPMYAHNNSEDVGTSGSVEATITKIKEENKSPEKSKNENSNKEAPVKQKESFKIRDTKNKSDLKQLDFKDTNKLKVESHSKTIDSEGFTSREKQNNGHSSESKLPEVVKIKSEIASPIKLSNENLSWTEKYKPKSTIDIIGQKDSNSNMNKLKKWLENWHKNQDPERRKKLPTPSPFNQYDGEWYKAALLSGPPGVGKTTTATLVARELGFDVVEFNASDTRNKKLLHEEISQMMHSTTVAGFISVEKNINKKRILLMDEVDGMAGNEDRGGIAELINFIKVASFPIICMCNNRDHQKMRTLVNHCYGLKFGRPNIQKVKAAMLSICFKENIKISPDALAQLIIGTGGDIRQTLNNLSMWSVGEKNLTSEVIENESVNSKKDVVYGPWDVIKKVFNSSENKTMTLSEKSRLFFYDYSIGPLFVQENYLQVTPDCTGPKNDKDREMLIRKCLAADALSMGDVVESKIRSSNNWALLESQAFYSTVLPSHYMSGTLGRTNFPAWLGKNSQRNKSLRMIGELYSHARISVSGDKFSMRLDYAEPLRNLLVRPMKTRGLDGVRDTFEALKTYSLLKDDLVNLCELLTGFSNPNVFNSIDPKVKSALTRLYNKEMVHSFAPVTTSKKKQTAETNLYGDENEETFSDQETEDNINDDTLIKVKRTGKAAQNNLPGTKGKGKGKNTESKASKGKAKK
ncbi:hypothetical protein GWI33_002903 [Rhynchophorus ferrugineus]|uniref:Replication factor C subunit 1 n=1 Tax=Rhynchophorus ferrugineus TaxID=354439 RepID=A0A834MHF2_RHYFE|nr:hypothetical protein GWI33_002903 [Rhynchophorus ferrugineus]